MRASRVMFASQVMCASRVKSGAHHITLRQSRKTSLRRKPQHHLRRRRKHHCNRQVQIKGRFFCLGTVADKRPVPLSCEQGWKTFGGSILKTSLELVLLQKSEDQKLSCSVRAHFLGLPQSLFLVLHYKMVGLLVEGI